MIADKLEGQNYRVQVHVGFGVKSQDQMTWKNYTVVFQTSRGASAASLKKELTFYPV